MKLTLLGTGSPSPSTVRRGPGQVIEAGNDLILVDCGAGTLHRLVEAGYNTLPLTAIAFTHLHSDHVTGILDVLWAGWIQRRWQTPPVVYGPPGTRHFIDHLIEAMSYDIKVRVGPILRRELLVPRVEEIEEDWRVSGADWRLSAFRVEHMPVDQAFGFRLDQDNSSIVISGDTKECDNLIEHAQDASLLVHEVFWSKGLEQIAATMTEPEERARFELLKTYHTGSAVIGNVAEGAGARQLVLSHLLRAQGDADSFAADIEPNYGGKLTLGEDLMTFEV
ncbi:MAG TPA: MBL fold metallo-hydrolase [Dehalococcoidia bacterium]|nr:MBL fold metallo-hydrolase [Dehalococcoidia bacterium]